MINIGDKFTEEEYTIYRNYRSYSTSFEGKDKLIKIDKDAWFLFKDNVYVCISTWESRINDQDTGHASIHRKESKRFKSYYDQRKH